MSNISEQVLAVINEHGPLSEMDIACELDVSYKQVRGAALALMRSRRARWFRGRLCPTPTMPSVDARRGLPPAGTKVRADLPVGSQMIHRIVGTLKWAHESGEWGLVSIQSVYAFWREHEQSGRELPRGEYETVRPIDIVDY